MQDLRQKLKVLLEKKENADMLSESDKVKWRNRIKKLNDEIIEVRTALYNEAHQAPFSFGKLEDLLIKSVKQAALEAGTFCWNYDEAFKRFLEENPINRQELIVMADDVEYSFRIMNTSRAITAIHNYTKKIKQVVRAFMELKCTGFKPLSDVELQQMSIEDIFRSEGVNENG